jgi:hypothetical protein
VDDPVDIDVDVDDDSTDPEENADHSTDYDCPESPVNHEDILTLYKWTLEHGHSDFLPNLMTVVKERKLSGRNILFMLFVELVRYLAKPTNFRYQLSTLLWYLAGVKQFGLRWLRFMKGHASNCNFAAPVYSTLQRIYPRKSRKPGTFNPP